VVEDLRAGQPRDEVGDRLMETACFEGLLLEPADLGGHVRGVARNPGYPAQFVRVNDLRLRFGAAVHPDDAGAERPPVRVHGDAAVELAGDPEGPDIGRGAPGGGERLGDRGPERVLPERRRLLGPAGAREIRLVGRGGFAQQAQAVVQDDRLEALRADIDADDGDRSSPSIFPASEPDPKRIVLGR